MRTIQEVNQDILNTCAKIGQLEVQKTNVLAEVDALLGPLHAEVAKLRAEGKQIQAVQEELAKQTAEAEAAKTPAQEPVVNRSAATTPAQA